MNDDSALGMTVTTSEEASGMLISLIPTAEWPKAKSRSPMRSVTVPVAASRRSPSTKTAATELPGPRSESIAALRPPPNSESEKADEGSRRERRVRELSPNPEAPQSSADRPSFETARAKRSSSSSSRPAGIFRARISSSRTAAPRGAGAPPIGLGAAPLPIARIEAIGVMPAIGSVANGQEKATAPASRPSK